MSNKELFVYFMIGIVAGEVITAPFTGGFNIGDVSTALFWSATALVLQHYAARETHA